MMVDFFYEARKGGMLGGERDALGSCVLANAIFLLVS
jgi:hypothetical protein